MSVEWTRTNGSILLLALLLTGLLHAAEPTSSSTTGTHPRSGPPETNDGIPWLVPWVDYSGSFWTRPALTGDWGSTRQQLMDKGLRFDMNLTQTLQRNMAGGKAYEGSYTGNLRYGLRLD